MWINTTNSHTIISLHPRSVFFSFFDCWQILTLLVRITIYIIINGNSITCTCIPRNYRSLRTYVHASWLAKHTLLFPTDSRCYTIIKHSRFAFCFVLKMFFSLHSVIELFLCAYKVSATNINLNSSFSQTYQRRPPSRMDLVYMKLWRDLVFL